MKVAGIDGEYKFCLLRTTLFSPQFLERSFPHQTPGWVNQLRNHPLMGLQHQPSLGRLDVAGLDTTHLLALDFERELHVGRSRG